jgi:hypothetical protein
MTIPKPGNAFAIKPVNPVAELPFAQLYRFGCLRNGFTLMKMKHPRQPLPNTSVRFPSNQPPKFLCR